MISYQQLNDILHGTFKLTTSWSDAGYIEANMIPEEAEKLRAYLTLHNIKFEETNKPWDSDDPNSRQHYYFKCYYDYFGSLKATVYYKIKHNDTDFLKAPDIKIEDIENGYKPVAIIDATDLDDVFKKMQGEVWSPNGEARELIETLCLKHTSMSISDIVKFYDGYYICDTEGWKKIANSKPVKTERKNSTNLIQL